MVLALCALFAGISAYRVWVEEEALGPTGPSEEMPTPPSEKRETDKRSSSRGLAYAVIAERTLFSPDRVEYLPAISEAVAEEKEPVISGKRVNLHGVVIMENDRKALIDNPRSGPDEPSKKWVRVGDSLGNLLVTAIERESVSLKEGGKEYRVPLYRKQGSLSPSSDPDQGSPTASPTVVSTETKTESTVAKKRIPEASREREDEAAGETETIQTPFGTITRKKRSNNR